MCSYYADRYKSGFITPEHFLKVSMSVMGNDASLMNFWNINKQPKFFGFDASIIIDGTINDVECMIIRDYEYSKNNKKL